MPTMKAFLKDLNVENVEAKRNILGSGITWEPIIATSIESMELSKMLPDVDEEGHYLSNLFCRKNLCDGSQKMLKFVRSSHNEGAVVNSAADIFCDEVLKPIYSTSTKRKFEIWTDGQIF